MTRREFPLPQNMGNHRRSRCLAMRPGNNHARLGMQNRREAFRPSKSRSSGIRRRRQSRILWTNRRRIDHRVHVLHRLRRMRSRKFQSADPQTLGLSRSHPVRSAHPVSHLQQKTSQPAHPGSGHSNQMHPQRFIPIEKLFAEFLDGHPSITVAIFSAASGTASDFMAADIVSMISSLRPVSMSRMPSSFNSSCCLRTAAFASS